MSKRRLLVVILSVMFFLSIFIGPLFFVRYRLFGILVAALLLRIFYFGIVLDEIDSPTVEFILERETALEKEQI